MFAIQKKTYLFSLLFTLLLLVALSANLSLFLHIELIPLDDRQHLMVGYVTAGLTVLLVALFSLLAWQQTKQNRHKDPQLSDIISEDSFFRLLSEQSNDMIHLNDAAGKLLYANPITSSILGYDLDEMINEPAEKFIHPDHRELIRTDMAKVARGKHVPAREITLVTKTGDPVDVEVKGFAYLPPGHTGYLGAVLRDVTERNKNIQFSRLYEEWEKTFNTISDFVSIHDKDFRVTRANKALCDFLAMPPEKIIGRYCYQLFHDRTEPIDGCPHVEANKTGRPVTVELSDTHLGIPIQVTCSPFFNKGGEFSGSVHLARPVADIPSPSHGNEKENFITVCASCKSIRDNKGKWKELEEYLTGFQGSRCTHTICRHCQQRLYPQFAD